MPLHLRNGHGNVCFGRQRGGGASDQPAQDVIEAEIEFGGKLTEGAGGAQAWGTSGEARKIAPIASNDEYSLEKMGHNDGWLNNIQRTLTTPINAATELGVSITGEGNTKVSNMGVALWLYVGDESTLIAIKDASFKVWVGPAGGSTWHEDQKISSASEELKVGWNELVLLHNPNWYATYSGQNWTANPTDEQINEIKYMSVMLENMATASKQLAINNIRLVKTSQTRKLVINRQENYSVEDSDAVDMMAALKSISGAEEVDAELPDGSTGKAVKFTAAEVQGGAFETPVNATIPAHGWNENYNMWSSNVTLSFWWYLEDAVTYKEFVANATSGWSAFQISSMGDTFGAEGTVGFDIKSSNGTGANKTETDMYRYFKTGWNHVFISFWGNGIDLTSIKAFRLLNFNGAQQDALFYDMKIARGNVWQRGVVNDGATGDPFPNSSHKIELFKGDENATVANWTGVSDTLSEKVPNTTYKKSLAATVGAAKTTVEYTPTDIDVSNYTEKFLTLTAWIYTDNARALNDKALIEKPSVSISESTEKLETTGYTVEFGSGFVNGWNQIKVRFTDDAKIDKDQTLDLSKLNYYKFSFPMALGADKTLLITGVTLFEENSRDAFKILSRLPDIDTSAPVITRKVDLPFADDAQDEIDSWDQNAFGIMPYSPDDGKKSIYFQNGDNGIVQAKHRFAPVDLSDFNMSHTVLTFWLYINDVDALLGDNGQLELGNGNSEDDANEIGWDITEKNLGELGLQSGKWNKIALKIIPEGYPGSPNVKGNVDFTEIRFMRLYSLKEKEGSSIRLLLSSMTFEEMDTTDFAGIKNDVKLLETKDFTEGNTPGAIDIYDMLASSDGTFPQARSLTLTSDKTEIKVGEFAQLTATVNPEYAPKNATYSVDDDTVASVDSTGKVTGLKAGEVTITATTANGKKASVTITVTANPEDDDNQGGNTGDNKEPESGKKKCGGCGGFAGDATLPIAAGTLIVIAGAVLIARKKRED